MRPERTDKRSRRAGPFLASATALALCAAPSVGGASGSQLAEVIAAHCRAREATVTLRTRFVQTKVFETLGEADTSSGVLYYRKPESVRWQYFMPDTSWTVLRGDKGWAVFPGIRQVQKFDLKQSRVEAVLSIVGFGSCGQNLADIFQITLSTSTDGSYVLAMVPKKPEIGAYFDRVDLTLDPHDYLPRKVVMHETAGDTVRFEFLELQRGARVDDKLFEYEAPKGYEIVE